VSLLSLLLLALLIICALGTAFSQREMVAVIVYSAFSIVLSVVWVLLESPDLAITQTAVGVGISCVLYFVALRRIGGVRHYAEPGRRDVFEGKSDFALARSCIRPRRGARPDPRRGAAAPISGQPDFGTPPLPPTTVSRRYRKRGGGTGAVNMVTGMILDYRAFDTLGESFVLFSAFCIALMLLTDSSGRTEVLSRLEDGPSGGSQDIAVLIGCKVLLPLVMLFGIYVVLNGHLSPGGGFAGGSILGTSLILYSIAFAFDVTDRFLNRRCCPSSSPSRSFFTAWPRLGVLPGRQRLPTGIPQGTPGSLLRRGSHAPHIAVGIVVACTLNGLFMIRRGVTIPLSVNVYEVVAVILSPWASSCCCSTATSEKVNGRTSLDSALFCS
jgi:multicomponent Na+:H+ antiporter subunit B